jgi:hypothetical protein
MKGTGKLTGNVLVVSGAVRPVRRSFPGFYLGSKLFNKALLNFLNLLAVELFLLLQLGVPRRIRRIPSSFPSCFPALCSPATSSTHRAGADRGSYHDAVLLLCLLIRRKLGNHGYITPQISARCYRHGFLYDRNRSLVSRRQLHSFSPTSQPCYARYRHSYFSFNAFSPAHCQLLVQSRLAKMGIRTSTSLPYETHAMPFKVTWSGNARLGRGRSPPSLNPALRPHRRLQVKSRGNKTSVRDPAFPYKIDAPMLAPSDLARTSGSWKSQQSKPIANNAIQTAGTQLIVADPLAESRSVLQTKRLGRQAYNAVKAWVIRPSVRSMETRRQTRRWSESYGPRTPTIPRASR